MQITEFHLHLKKNKALFWFIFSLFLNFGF